MEKPDFDSSGGRLAWARERAGYASRADFSRIAGVKDVTYRAYELNQNKFAKHAPRFGELLGVSAAWLIDGGPLPDGPTPPVIVPNATPFKFEGASDGHPPEDVPVYGTVLGASQIYDGEAIEQTTLNTGDVLTYFKRPSILNGQKDIYGVFVAGSSMDPRYGEGEAVIVDGKRPPRVGDDVVVYLRVPDEDMGERDACVLIKRLVRRGADFIELRQFNPPTTFRIAGERVSKVHRVIPASELFS